jgi:hypothetical protein
MTAVDEEKWKIVKSRLMRMKITGVGTVPSKSAPHSDHDVQTRHQTSSTPRMTAKLSANTLSQTQEKERQKQKPEL